MTANFFVFLCVVTEITREAIYKTTLKQVE